MKKPPLRSFRAENFKAIRNSGRVGFGGLTVFIGNNGVGKSSLVEALEAYRDIVVRGVDFAFEKWHGFGHVINKAAPTKRRTGFFPETRTLHFSLRGKWGKGAYDAKMILGVEPAASSPRIQSESLTLPLGRKINRSADGRCETINDGSQERVRRVALGESAAPQDWVQELQRWQFLALDPEAIGEPTRQTLVSGVPTLNRNGSNLAQYLWSLRSASVSAFEQLLEAIQCVLPYARDMQPIFTEAIERFIHLEMTEHDFKIPGWLLSTGTLRVLALLACLRHPTPPPVLVVEEVENGLDPRTLHLVVEDIRAAISAGTTQVILTTHSPYLLDLLDLSHIVVVEREEGQPVFRRPDVKQLEDWSKSFSPGRLYTMGRLTGGTP
jgi:predicted ATPase